MEPWRQFEILVAQIESALLPRGAIVKCPDRLPDLVTGQLREVDASIRLNVGSTQMLITLECRDRVAAQDDTWIEQLATKKLKIGAAATIAVSSSRFSEPATRSAKLFGIELRTLKPLNEAEAKDWVEKTGIKAEFREWRFSDVKFLLNDAPAEVELADDLLSRLDESFYEAVIATSKSNGHPLTLGELGGFFVQHGLYPPIPRIRAFGEVRPSEGPYFIATSIGEVQLIGVKIEVEVNSIETDVPIKQVLEYGAFGKPLVRVAEHELTRPDGNITIGFIHNLERTSP